jgi:hypothetical protein
MFSPYNAAIERFVRSARAPNGAREARALPGPSAPGPAVAERRRINSLALRGAFFCALVKSPMSLGDDILLHFHDDERKTVAR